MSQSVSHGVANNPRYCRNCKTEHPTVVDYGLGAATGVVASVFTYGALTYMESQFGPSYSAVNNKQCEIIT